MNRLFLASLKEGMGYADQATAIVSPAVGVLPKCHLH